MKQNGSVRTWIAQFDCKTEDWPHEKNPGRKGRRMYKEEENSLILIFFLKIILWRNKKVAVVCLQEQKHFTVIQP